jgi:hypothetical protein
LRIGRFWRQVFRRRDFGRWNGFGLFNGGGEILSFSLHGGLCARHALVYNNDVIF